MNGKCKFVTARKRRKNISAAGGVHQSETKKVWNRLCSAGGVEGGRRHYEGQSHQKVEKKLHSCNAIDTTASFGFSFFLLFTLAVSTCTVNSLFLSRFLSLSLFPPFPFAAAAAAANAAKADSLTRAMCMSHSLASHLKIS